MDNLIHRREFLSILGTAGAYTLLSTGSAMGRMRGAGMCMMNTGFAGTIDPPPGDVFKNPVELANQSTNPGNVEVSIESAITPVKIGTWDANLTHITGFSPALQYWSGKGTS